MRSVATGVRALNGVVQDFGEIRRGHLVEAALADGEADGLFAV